ncbi:hypothetical protein [Spirosoma foliorum]|uniref:Uncharacterized protein n=1 Tax=Spirosoma foliorum TaxID=2710596 RepID=A0A7G5H6F0_9BACT|nr:hypothetical protein [Spirosoma foliorum]QMW06692.1 hypothetical protein H3H32_18270 [Spirosoma foliorum]
MNALKRISAFFFCYFCLFKVYSQETLSLTQKREFARIYGVSGAPVDRQEFIKSQLKKQALSPAKRKNFLVDSTTEKEIIKNYLFWHDYSLDISATDHLTSATPTDFYAEQLGPHKASRAFAITHVAIFEAINSVIKKYTSYRAIQQKIFDISGLPSTISLAQVNLNYAIAEAAKQTLLKLYPKKAILINNQYTKFIQSLPTEGASKDTSGALIGRASAEAVWMDRNDDRANYPEPPASAVTTNDFRNWTKDTLSNINTALGGNWSKVRPFVLLSQDAFRPCPPPSFDSTAFVKAFNDVKNLGGDPLAETSAIRRPTPTSRKGEELQDLNDANETYKGILWGYDGTGNLCAPPKIV